MNRSIMLTIHIVWLCLLVAKAFGATYYVSASGGNDSNGGVSPGSPWKTIAKVNSIMFNPGDIILFQRGEVWRESLIPASGNENGYITYKAYGEGNKPLLLGSLERNKASDWSNEGNNIWSTGDSSVIGPELLPNASFDTDIYGWSLYVNSSNGAAATGERTTVSSEYDSAPGGGKIYCSVNGIASSDIQLYTSSWSIQKDTWYKFSFRAKASEPFQIPSIELMQNDSPWALYYSASSNRTVNITTAWSTFTVYYRASSTANDARITLFLGNSIPENALLYLDTLNFKEAAAEPFSGEVGNMIFNGEARCGIRVWQEQDLNSQGKFFYNKENSVLKMYSVDNPAQFYTDIECALKKTIIDQTNKSYVLYENLDIRYGGAHGIGGGTTHHIIIRDCDVSYIGGGEFANGVRYGNGIEFWENAHDNIIERCRISQIYDSALTNQGLAANNQYNIYYRNNIIQNCEASFEYWNQPQESQTNNIYFENNTCANAGGGWGHNQRPDGANGRHLLFYGIGAVTNNFYIRNNIFYESTESGLRLGDPADITDLVLDYNCWYESAGPLIRIGTTEYAMDGFASYQQSGQDVHSIAQNPLFRSNNFMLQAHSPCIDKALPTAVVTEDFQGVKRPQGTEYDIGAYEFTPLQATEQRNPEAGEIKIYNNPFNPLKGEKLIINYGLGYEGHAAIKIYNIAGELITTLLDENGGSGDYTIYWHGRNDAGQIVASNVYLLFIDVPGLKTVKKIGVIK